MKEIELTQGKVAIVDYRDYEWLSHWGWFAIKPNTSHTWYARRTGSISMHRQIMGYPRKLEIDHINGNGLDNRRENLRTCTRQESMQSRPTTWAKSGFRGVYWIPQGRKNWRSLITVDSKTIYLGDFLTKEEAAFAYNDAAFEYFGEFARFNEVNYGV